MRPLLRHVGRTLLTVGIVMIIVAGVAVGLARLLLPLVGEYRQQAARELSVLLQRPVRIGTLAGAWDGIDPMLELSDVSILDKTAQHTLLHFARMRGGIDLLGYLRTRIVTLKQPEVSGATLSIRRQADGRIVVDGFEEQSGAKSPAMDWLLRQPSLVVSSSELYWTDEQRGTHLHFNDVGLSVLNRGSLSEDAQHHIEASAALAPPAGQQLKVKLDFNGELAQPHDWAGRFNVQGDQVALADGIGQPLPGITLTGGTADFKLDGDWSEARLNRLQGQAAVRQVVLGDPQTIPAQLALLGGQLAWQRQAQGWLLDVTHFIMQPDGKPAPESQFRIRSSAAPLPAAAPAGGSRPAALDAQFKVLRLESLNTLLLASGRLPAGLRAALAGLRPQGELHELHVQLLAADKPFSIDAQLVAVQTSAWKKLPSLNNLSGLLTATDSAGSLNIDSRRVGAELDGVFSAPLQFDTVAGALNWHKEAQAWRIESSDVHVQNADLNASVSGVVELPLQGGAPFLNLSVNLTDGAVNSVSRYLPINHLGEKTRSWLAQALVGGRIVSGSATLYGVATDFPFVTRPGSFQARLKVADAAIDYADNWPRVSGIAAEVLFYGHSLAINASGGRSLDAIIDPTRADIADMTAAQPVLVIRGGGHSSGPEALDFIRNSPLQDKLGVYVSDLSPSGPVSVAMTIDIPLHSKERHVQGTLQLTDNDLHWVNRQAGRDVELKQVNGALDFTETSLSGKNISASFHDLNMNLAVRTDTPQAAESGKALLIDATGRLTARDIGVQARALGLSNLNGVLERFDGAAHWSASLALKGGKGAGLSAALAIQSDLQGLAVGLPPPFGKAADGKVALTVNTTLGTGQAAQYAIGYGKNINSIIEITTAEAGSKLSRGELRFGGSVPVLPEQGLRITGALEQFSLGPWIDLLGAADPDAAHSVGQAGALPEVDVQLGSLDAFGQTLSDAGIKARPTEAGWLVDVDSPQVSGRLTLPQSSSAVWVMDFDHIYLPAPKDDQDESAADKPDSSFDPRRLPAMRITSRHFRYGETELGQVTVEAAKTPDGLTLDTLKLAAPDMDIAGQGSWRMEQGRPVSRLTLKVKTASLGRTLSGFGYTSAIADGKAQLDIDAHWRGGPMNFALAKLDGRFAMDVGKGRLLDVEPGAGRIFGLLSLQALPRRLSLDFSDLFLKGFAFDSIAGTFRLENGTAHTSDMVMKGPAAQVAVTGATDLAARQYDQVVTVVPHLGASLPLVATLAGGPIAGAAVLLAQKLLKSNIEAITDRQYSIRGPWKDPMVQTLAEKKTVETEENDAELHKQPGFR